MHPGQGGVPVDEDLSTEVDRAAFALMKDEGPLPMVDFPESQRIVANKFLTGMAVDDLDLACLIQQVVAENRTFLMDPSNSPTDYREAANLSQPYLYLSGNGVLNTCNFAQADVLSRLFSLNCGQIELYGLQNSDIMGRFFYIHKDSKHLFIIARLKGSDTYVLIDTSIRQFFRKNHAVANSEEMGHLLMQGYHSLTDSMLVKYCGVFYGSEIPQNMVKGGLTLPAFMNCESIMQYKEGPNKCYLVCERDNISNRYNKKYAPFNLFTDMRIAKHLSALNRD